METRLKAPLGTERIRGGKHKAIRERILTRDLFTCQRCNQSMHPRHLEVDHIVPLTEGGRESDSNRQTLCRWCHKEKTGLETRNRVVG